MDGLIELLGLSLHGSVDNLGLVEVGGHLVDLGLDLALGLLNLGKLGIEVVNGSLSLGVPGGQLHLGHLELLSLGNSLLLVLLSHGSGISLSLGVESEDVLTARGLLVESLLGNINLMFQVSVLAQQKLSLSGLIVTESLDVIELSSQGSLGLGKHVEVVLKISNNAEKFTILVGNLVLGHSKVSKSQVGSINLLVGSIQCVNQTLIGLVSRGLASDNFLSCGSGISNILAKLHNLSLALLVELNLGNGSSTGLIVSVTELFNLTSEVRSLTLSLGTSLTFGFKFLFSSLNTSLEFLDVLLGLSNK